MTGVAQFHMTFANNTAVRQLLGDHPTASRQLDHPRWTWESGPWGGLNEPWNDIVNRASEPAKSTLLAGAEVQKSRIISWQSPPTWCVIQAGINCRFNLQVRGICRRSRQVQMGVNGATAVSKRPMIVVCSPEPRAVSNLVRRSTSRAVPSVLFSYTLNAGEINQKGA